MKRILLGLLIIAPSSAFASDFGAQGSIVPGGRVELSYLATEAVTGDEFIYMRGALGPEVDYFLFDNISIGAGASVTAGLAAGFKSVSYAGRLALGYHHALSDDVGFYPKVAISYGYGSSSSGLGLDDRVDTRADFEWSAPLLFHRDHFFIGMGPLVTQTIFNRTRVGNGTPYDNNSTFSMALTTTIGGWF